MLVSGDVAERLGDRFTLRRLPCARLKGRNGNVVVAEVLDALPSGIAGARRETLPSFENAVDSWAQGDMALAEQHLTTVLAEDPDDGLVQYFIRRIREET